MYSAHLDEFHDSRVIELNEASDWKGPEFAYRLREDYEDPVSLSDRLQIMLSQPDVQRLESLIIGAWSKVCEGGGAEEVVSSLVQCASRLPALKHLFFAEMVFEECEVSWINHSDISPVLAAFPNLESLRIRGANGLSFSKIRHEHLRELAVESGGLSRDTIRDIFLCEFPALEHLELLLGEPGYGFDGGVEDLQPLLSGELFPRLKWLGLMNSAIANEIAAVVVNAPVLSRLEVLDLSLGNLDAEGIQSLHGLAEFPNLKTLNISHHFGTEADIISLKNALQCTVIADDRQEPEDDWRFVVHAE